MDKNSKAKREFVYVLIYSILIILIIASVVYIVNFLLLRKEVIEESKLLNTVQIDENQVTEEEPKGVAEENIIEETQIIETERMLQVKELQNENPDIVGWLEIEGTTINYPVLQGSDNEYYMTHNYKKQKSKMVLYF